MRQLPDVKLLNAWFEKEANGHRQKRKGGGGRRFGSTIVRVRRLLREWP